MDEGEPCPSCCRFDEAALLCDLQRVEDAFRIHLGRLGEQAGVEVAADDRRHREDAVRLVVEGTQTATDHLAHALGDADAIGRGCSHPPLVLQNDCARFHEVAQHLADEERIAFGLGVDGVSELGDLGVERLVGGGLDERSHFTFVEPAQRHPLDGLVAPQIGEHLGQRMTAVELRVSIRAHHEQRCIVPGPHEVTEHQERRLRRPVQVVEQEDHRHAGGRVLSRNASTASNRR